MNSSKIALKLSSAIQVNDKPYWGAHFLSVLECLIYHKNLDGGFYGLRQLEMQQKTMGFLKGNNVDGFFLSMKGYLYNWGFQYLLCNYLNLDASKYIVSPLLNCLAEEFSLDLSLYNGATTKFFVYGEDSLLYGDKDLSEILKGNTVIFPKKNYSSYEEIRSFVRYSDICLILFGKDTSIPNVAFFGEIEGNNGRYLRRNSFWIGKSEFCIFGIGVVKNIDRSIYMNVVDFFNKNLGSYYRKVIIEIEAGNYIVNDFYKVVDAFQRFFTFYSPVFKTYDHDKEFDYFCNLIIKNWNTDIYTLRNLLRSHVYNGDVLGDVDSVKKDIIIIPSLNA